MAMGSVIAISYCSALPTILFALHTRGSRRLDAEFLGCASPWVVVEVCCLDCHGLINLVMRSFFPYRVSEPGWAVLEGWCLDFHCSSAIEIPYCLSWPSGKRCSKFVSRLISLRLHPDRAEVFKYDQTTSCSNVSRFLDCFASVAA